MDLAQLIKGRRTIHDYTSQPVDERLLLTALELGLFAPNHKHTHPWRFFRLKAQARQKIADLAVQLKMEKSGTEMSEGAKSVIRQKFMSPAELIVLARKISGDDFTDREDFASIAAAVQNICLYLWSHNIGTKWSTGGVTRHQETYKVIDVSSQEIAIEGFLWVGYAQKIPITPSRPHLKDVLYER